MKEKVGSVRSPRKLVETLPSRTDRSTHLLVPCGHVGHGGGFGEGGVEEGVEVELLFEGEKLHQHLPAKVTLVDGADGTLSEVGVEREIDAVAQVVVGIRGDGGEVGAEVGVLLGLPGREPARLLEAKASEGQ